MTRLQAENDAPRAYERAQRLQATVPDEATPEDRIRVLNVLARTESYMAQPDIAHQHAHEALSLARTHQDRVGEVEALLNLALILVDLAQLDALAELTPQTLAALEGVDRPDLLSEALVRTAMTYRRMGQIDVSVNTTMRAMEIARQTNNPLALTYAYQGLGITYSQSDRHREAREHFTAMREQARAAQSKLLEAYALVSMGSTIGNLGDLAAAEAHVREAIALYREVGAPFSINFGLFGLAHNFRNRGRHQEALPLLDEIVERYQQHPSKIGLWHTLNARSDTHLALADPAAAMADAERAQALAEAISLPLYRTESLRRLASVAATTGDHQRAYLWEAAAAELSNKTSREKSSARIEELAERYEAESKRLKIEELTRRNQQQAEELRQRTVQQRWLWTVLGGTIIVIAGTMLLLLRLRRSHRLVAAVNAQVRRSQAELQQQTDILQSILDSMGEGVSVADERGRLVLVNPAAEKIVGSGLFKENEADHWTQRYGFYRSDRLTPYPTEELPLVRAIHGESCDQSEIFLRNQANREGRWLSVTARPLRDKTGSTRGAVAVFSDVTVHKQAEEKIRALNASLEHRVQERTAQLQVINRELEAFSYSVSHDLRAPLRSIEGFSRIMLEDYSGRLDPEGVDNLNTIRTATQRMSLLIDDMLRLSRVTRAELHQTTVDMSDLAATVVVDLQKEFPTRAVEFVNQPGLVMEADASLMRVVLQNLLGNAWKFTSRQPAARVEFGRTVTVEGEAFFVRDNGVGFDASRANKLFVAFQRLHTHADFPGTGIGLATVQRIIHRHGGHVWAESTPGHNTTFFFTIPPAPKDDHAT